MWSNLRKEAKEAKQKQKEVGIFRNIAVIKFCRTLAVKGAAGS